MLCYLKYLSPAPLLSMKNLTLKLVMLMALVSLSRANLLHKLDLRFRVFKRDGVLFTLPPVRKSSRVTSPLIDITFPAFPQDHRICIVSYLKTYERKTNLFIKSARIIQIHSFCHIVVLIDLLPRLQYPVGLNMFLNLLV